MADLQPGREIAGRYVIEAPLGEGGMGVVAVARDRRLDRRVALKLLPKERLGNAEARERLLREARAAAALQHPAIVQVHDAGETPDGGAFVVLELVKGKTLRALFRSGGLGRAAGLRALAEAARALGTAHRAGLIHRDVKPDNLMLRDDGRIAILDFGLARPIEPVAGAPLLTAEGTIVGTPAYMAPEQAVGGQLDGRTDQFALAVVAFELLAGRVPWDAANPVAVMAQIIKGPVPSPSSLEPGLPKDADEVLLEALARDPADRFPDMESFAAALERLAAACVGVASAELASTQVRVTDAPTETVETRRPAATWRNVAIAAGAMVLGLIVCSPIDFPKTRQRPERGSVFPRPGSVLSCPLFEARWKGAPAPWLGAAAATAACERAALGAPVERTRTPAELLDLPRTPLDSFPAAPFDAPDALGRMRTAAYSLATSTEGVVLEGQIEASGNAFRVRLRVGGRVSPDSPRAPAVGQGPDPVTAVHEALRKLPLSEAGDEPGLSWLLADSRQDLLLLDDWAASLQSGVAVGPSCRQVVLAAARLGPIAALADRRCRELVELPGEPLPLPELDSSSPALRWRSVTARAQTDPEADPAALAAHLEPVRSSATTVQARAVLAATEAQLALRRGDTEQARTLALRALQENPRLAFAWNLLSPSSYNQPGFEPTHRAMSAWVPHLARGWNERAATEKDVARRLEFQRRAVALAPGVAHYSLKLAESLVSAGEREEARALVAQLDQSGFKGPAEAARVLVEASEGKLGAARSRGVKALLALDAFGRPLAGDELLLDWTLQLAEALGRARETADAIVEKLGGEKPRLHPGGIGAARGLALACARASPDLARACFAGLRDFMKQGRFPAGHLADTALLLDGAEAYSRGELMAASAAWRQLVPSGRAPWLAAEAFDASGEPALAEQVDAAQMRRPFASGVSPAQVRTARRAAKSGDKARAQTLAKQLVEAWQTADEPPPTLAEMRSLAK